VSIEDGPVRVTYDRIARDRSPSLLTVGTSPPTGTLTEIAISRSWLDSFQVVDIRPVPASSRVDADRVWYEFQGSGAVEFRLRPEAIGWLSGEISIGDADTRLDTVVLP
jgi:hypothetical protein